MSPSAQKIALATTRALVYGGLALVDPSKLSGWRKHAFWLGMAGVSAVESAVLVPEQRYRPVEEVVGTASLTGGLVYGGREVWTAVDRWMMGGLASAGLPRPRWWYAAASAVGAAAMTFVEFPDPDAAEWVDERPVEEVPDGVRTIVSGLLGGIDGYGSDELAAQLQGAQVRVDEGVWDFVVDDDAAPRTVISDYQFPVIGTFRRGGADYWLVLDVFEGRLGALSVQGPWDDDAAEPDFSLPDAADVVYSLGTPDYYSS